MINIGVQGIAGSFSEMAGRQFCEQAQMTDIQIHYLINSEPVVAAVENRSIDYGIIAIENSLGSVVEESIHALAKHRCRVEAIFPFLVEQNLLTLPGTAIEDIAVVRSHSQALRQCQGYLSQQLAHCELIADNDTADCARRLQSGELSSDTAVIANRACAELYGLDILANNIHDLNDNTTLFLALTTIGE